MAEKFDKQDETLLAEVRKRMQDCIDYNDAQHEVMREDIDFRHGNQWDDTAKQERAEEGRPCLTFNRIEGFVDQVMGDARQNKSAIKVRPTDNVDKIVTSAGGSEYTFPEFLEGAVRSIEVKSNASNAYLTALDGAVGHGEGYFAIGTKYTSDDSFDQDIIVRRLNNSFAVYLDPNSTEPDGSDANYGFISTYMDHDEVKGAYPDAAAYYNGTLKREWDEGNAWASQNNQARIVEYYRRVPDKTVKIIRFMDGSVLEDNEENQESIEALGKAGIGQTGKRSIVKYKVEWYLTDGNLFLEEPTEFPSQYIPIVPVYGKELVVNGKIWRRGIVRHAKDAQRIYNYQRTAAVERIALTPKAPYLAADGQLKGYEKIWKNANTKNYAVMPYKHVDGVPMPQRAGYTLPNNTENQDAMLCAEDMKATTGIYDASLGAGGNETSGRAILARQREGDTANYAYTDNLSTSIRHAGRIILDMLPRIYDTPRVMRILNVDDTDDLAETNLAELMDGIKFDVEVTTGASYATQRLEASDSMMAFIQAVPQAAPAVMDLIAKNQDWPGGDEIAKRLEKMLPEGLMEDDTPEGEMAEPPPPTPEQIMAMKAQEMTMQKEQLEMAKTQAEIEEKQADTALKMVKAQKEAQETPAEGETIGDMSPEELAAVVMTAIQENTQ